MISINKLLLAVSLLTFSIVSHAQHEFEELVQAAQDSPVTQRALEQDKQAKQAAIRDMDTLKGFIQSNASGVSIPDLTIKIRARLGEEKGHFDFSSKLFAPLQPGIQIPWSLKTHKMREAVDDLLGDTYLTESNVGKVLSGEHLFDMSLTEDSFPAVLNKGFWGTSQGTRYELFLLTVAAELMNPTGKNPVTATKVLEEVRINIDDSPIAHIVPLPKNVTNWSDYLGNSLFFVPDYFNGRPGFLSTHTGFLFGGHRNVDETSSLEPRYPEGKPFGPEDCSSYVAKMFGYKGVIATLYQWMFWKSSFEQDSYEAILRGIDDEHASDIRAKVAELGIHFKVIRSREEAMIGDIIGYRTQAEGKPLGTGGHTGLFFGNSPSGNPLFFVGNRGLPQTQMDGIGLEEKPLPSTAQFFAMRPKVSE